MDMAATAQGGGKRGPAVKEGSLEAKAGSSSGGIRRGPRVQSRRLRMSAKRAADAKAAAETNAAAKIRVAAEANAAAEASLRATETAVAGALCGVREVVLEAMQQSGLALQL